MTLCGISSRFQLLSPTERQVPHALLTRSPLSCPRRNNPVRLACVRHAASVRPEPGSNSQKIVSKQPFQVAQIIFQVICSSKFYSRIFVGLNSINSNLNNSLIVQGVTCSSLRYSIYKVHHSLARTGLIYHTNFHLSIPFFDIFQICFCGPSSRRVPFIGQLDYYTVAYAKCQVLFYKFSVLFLVICTKYWH